MEARESQFSNPVSPSTLQLEDLRAAIATDLPAYLANLERLVNTDCGSYTPAGVNAVGRWTGEFLADLGADVEYRPDPDGRLGDTVVATFLGQPGGPRILLIGHLDTVFDPAPPPLDHSGSKTGLPTAPASPT